MYNGPFLLQAALAASVEELEAKDSHSFWLGTHTGRRYIVPWSLPPLSLPVAVDASGVEMAAVPVLDHGSYEAQLPARTTR